MSGQTPKERAQLFLKNNGGSEVDARENVGGVNELWQEIQELKQQMNIAKKEAAAEAAKPFLEQIEELEETYAFVLKLSS